MRGPAGPALAVLSAAAGARKVAGAALQDGAAQEAEAAGAGGAGDGVVVGLLVVGLAAPGTELGAHPLLPTTIVPPEVIAHHCHLPAKQTNTEFPFTCCLHASI